MYRRIATMLAVASMAAACSGSGGAGSAIISTPALNAADAELLPTVTPGLSTFDSDKFHQLLDQLRGTPVVVNIWASWCGPCRAEAPLLGVAARTYGDRVQFLGVDILDNRGAASAFVTEFRIPYPSVFDPTGEIRDSLGFIGVPDTIFFRADGSRSKTWSGPLDQQALTTNIRVLLAGSGSASPSTGQAATSAPAPS